MKLQTGTPFFVRNVVLVCSSASGMHQYFTVQLYTTWRHPGLSFVYETSLTFRWLTMIANCHLLTTTRRTDEGRGKNGIAAHT
jgi:hypothetical protein